MPAAAQPAAYTATGLTLSGAFGVFARCLNARLIAGALAAAIVIRVVLGGWSMGDAIVAAVILGLEPFTEWVIHVTVLHLRPVTIRGRTFDPIISRRHRLHHYRNEKFWFGVTVHVADHVLRTFPQKDAVATSPTARTLGIEPAA